MKLSAACGSRGYRQIVRPLARSAMESGTLYIQMPLNPDPAFG